MALQNNRGRMIKRKGKNDFKGKKDFNKGKKGGQAPFKKEWKEGKAPNGAPNGKPQFTQGRPNGKPQGRPNGKPQGRPKGKPQGKEEDESDFEEVDSTFRSSNQVRQNDNEEEADPCDNMQKLVQQQNRKKKKSGGFQAMGLSNNIFLGVTRKGYKVPTPIQRKTIPLIMDGKDVVAMARTGSGKTAAFLVPMLEKLKVHGTMGARAIIMSPTRELALQTLKFTRELGKYTNLKCAVILGGDSMENQFAALHENPDIIIATPGRFMHVVVEMNLKLSTVEYVVFDEADRLFEMGFQDQLTEVLKRLPEARQTLLFSATLPKLLVEFAQAGLHDPTLLRLDVDTKLSPNLTMSFISVRSADRLAVLLHLLKNVIKRRQQTVVFAATKYHVEYLHMVLKEAGIQSSYSFSALDPTARKINVAKFQHKKTSVLIVTDLAARGIDIPLLDHVINYNFPAKSKLFVHRVGRVARAGSSGSAISLVSSDELPFVLDLHLFLGRTFKVTKVGQEDEDGMIGRVPQRVVDDEEDNLRKLHENHDISSMVKVIDNAYKKYITSRPAPSSESIKRSKDFNLNEIPTHPLFGEANDPTDEVARSQLLESMKAYRPHCTIFEINSTNKTRAFDVMKVKRNYHDNKIQMIVAKQQDATNQKEAEQSSWQREGTEQMEDVSTEELQKVFSRVVAPKRPANDKVFEPKKKKRKREKPAVDTENYLHYRPKDFQSEKGLSMGSSFEAEAAKATMDLAGNENSRNKKEGQLRWDRKKKKFVRENGEKGGKKWVKTESGVWIPASYKTNMYKDWLNKSKKSVQEEDSDDEGVAKQQVAKQQTSGRFQVIGTQRRGRGFHQAKVEVKGQRPELKRKEQILKARKTKAKDMSLQRKRESKRGRKKGPKH